MNCSTFKGEARYGWRKNVFAFMKLSPSLEQFTKLRWLDSAPPVHHSSCPAVRPASASSSSSSFASCPESTMVIPLQQQQCNSQGNGCKFHTKNYGTLKRLIELRDAKRNVPPIYPFMNERKKARTERGEEKIIRFLHQRKVYCSPLSFNGVA